MTVPRSSRRQLPPAGRCCQHGHRRCCQCRLGDRQLRPFSLDLRFSVWAYTTADAPLSPRPPRLPRVLTGAPRRPPPRPPQTRQPDTVTVATDGAATANAAAETPAAAGVAGASAAAVAATAVSTLPLLLLVRARRDGSCRLSAAALEMETVDAAGAAAVAATAATNVPGCELIHVRPASSRR